MPFTSQTIAKINRNAGDAFMVNLAVLDPVGTMTGRASLLWQEKAAEKASTVSANRDSES
jgi:hypothetical protein